MVGGFIMAAITSLPIARPVAIPLREILPWAVFGGLLLVLGIYFIGVEQGATALFNGTYVHEFVHDGRHLLGFPCH
ncbi:hypothetical protein ACVIGA_008946 [Bradyrhizobium sp. USDA 3240]